MWATDLSGGWFYRKGAVNRMSIPVMVGNAVDDTVEILASTLVEGSVSLSLGDGDNWLTVDGTIHGMLSYRGRDGNDALKITEEAVVGQVGRLLTGRRHLGVLRCRQPHLAACLTPLPSSSR